MNDQYWIQEWAKVRQDEVVRLPTHFVIHEDFLQILSHDEIVDAFTRIWDLFVKLYGQMGESPALFGLPLYAINDTPYGSSQARESRTAPYRLFELLYAMLISGDLHENALVVDTAHLKQTAKVKSMPLLFQRLGDHGFVFEGLQNHKPSGNVILIHYPDNPHVLIVLKMMADKAQSTNRCNDFLCCHYKLFQDDMDTANYGLHADLVADKMHTGQERDFIYAMDDLMQQRGYFAHAKGWNEGPGYAYYDKESVMKKNGPYHLWMLSWKTGLRVYLRIRNVQACMEYISHCPDSVKNIFLQSDEGCANRLNGQCKSGLSYTINGVTYWRCGCCSAAFYFAPRIEDIPHYIELLALGSKK